MGQERIQRIRLLYYAWVSAGVRNAYTSQTGEWIRERLKCWHSAGCWNDAVERERRRTVRKRTNKRKKAFKQHKSTCRKERHALIHAATHKFIRYSQRWRWTMCELPILERKTVRQCVREKERVCLLSQIEFITIKNVKRVIFSEFHGILAVEVSSVLSERCARAHARSVFYFGRLCGYYSHISVCIRNVESRFLIMQILMRLQRWRRLFACA